MQVEAGKKYAWCSCGLSAQQPFCDGAHKGSGMGPVVFTAEADGSMWLCNCKHTGDAGGCCDGTHSSLP